jgi:sulfatase modifying factor 1
MHFFSLYIKLFNLLSAACLALMLCAGALHAQSDPLAAVAESLKGNVVAIRATFPDGSSEQGFGFITGEQGGRLFIATAAHVVFNEQKASGIEVQFSNDIRWVSAAYLKHWDQEDLALLELNKPAWVSWKPGFADFSPRLLQPVRFLGRYGGGEPRWVYPGPNGEVFEMAGHTISFSITTLQPGCSGAPLLSDKGIIGLVVSDAPSDSRALRLSRIRELLSNNGQYPYFGLQVTVNQSAPGTQPAVQNSSSNSNLPASIQKLEANMLPVIGGNFTMGCKNTQRDGDCVYWEKPSHSVKVSDFYISKYEVTQVQWRTVMGSDPSYNKGCDECPVESVSWNDIQNFLKKLNALTNKRYRLPTEAEWEYAARDGAQSRGYLYSGSNALSDVGWYDRNSGDKTYPVGGKNPNELGLYDMSGNVWEWCEDCWHDSYKNAPTVGIAWLQENSGDCRRRIIRGGSYVDEPLLTNIHCAARNGYDIDERTSFIGFRISLD